MYNEHNRFAKSFSTVIATGLKVTKVDRYTLDKHYSVSCIIVYAPLFLADVQSAEEEEPDADELIAAALSEARGQEGTYPNPHRPGPIDPQVHVSICDVLSQRSYIIFILKLHRSNGYRICKGH